MALCGAVSGLPCRAQEFHIYRSPELLFLVSGLRKGREWRPRVLKVSRAVAHLCTVCDSVVSEGWLGLWPRLVGLSRGCKS